MRTWTLVAAALVLASAGTTAAVLPDTGPAARQQDQHGKKSPDSTKADGPTREVQRLFELGNDNDVQIGVAIRDLEPDQARTMTGAVVSDVREDSPAAKAGLKNGDIVIEFDGEKVRSARHLSRLVGETAVGRPAKIVVQREGKRVDAQVTPEAGLAQNGNLWFRRLPDHDFAFKGPNFEFDGPAMHGLLEEHGHGGPNGPDVMAMVPGRRRLGVGIQSLTPQLAEYFGTKPGVLVTSVDDDSPAAKAGLKAGDVITSVGDTPVTSPTDLMRAVRRADEGTDFSIGYTRDKKSVTATARIVDR
jgi:serine protease Do